MSKKTTIKPLTESEQIELENLIETMMDMEYLACEELMRKNPSLVMRYMPENRKAEYRELRKKFKKLTKLNITTIEKFMLDYPGVL